MFKFSLISNLVIDCQAAGKLPSENVQCGEAGEAVHSNTNRRQRALAEPIFNELHTQCSVPTQSRSQSFPWLRSNHNFTRQILLQRPRSPMDPLRLLPIRRPQPSQPYDPAFQAPPGSTPLFTYTHHRRPPRPRRRCWPRLGTNPRLFGHEERPRRAVHERAGLGCHSAGLLHGAG